MKKVIINFLKKWQRIMGIIVVVLTAMSSVYSVISIKAKAASQEVELQNKIQEQLKINNDLKNSDKEQLKKIQEINNVLNKKMGEIQSDMAEIKGNMEIIITMMKNKEQKGKE